MQGGHDVSDVDNLGVHKMCSNHMRLKGDAIENYRSHQRAI